jgi:hypothetical protein
MKEFNLGRVAGLQLVPTAPLRAGSRGLAVAAGVTLARFQFAPGVCVVGAKNLAGDGLNRSFSPEE